MKRQEFLKVIGVGFLSLSLTPPLISKGAVTDNNNANENYYLKKEIDSILSGKSNNGHNHDDRYYTETEINTKVTNLTNAINSKATASHNHDDRYYTETEINTKINTLNSNIENVRRLAVGNDSDFNSMIAQTSNYGTINAPVQKGGKFTSEYQEIPLGDSAVFIVAIHATNVFGVVMLVAYTHGSNSNSTVNTLSGNADCYVACNSSGLHCLYLHNTSVGADNHWHVNISKLMNI